MAKMLKVNDDVSINLKQIVLVERRKGRVVLSRDLGSVGYILPPEYTYEEVIKMMEST